MISISSAKELTAYIIKQKPNKSIGFVPTMGALHQGHISLISQSKNLCDITVCSVFVNPTQFNNENDLINYPSTIDKDIKLLEDSKCDILFCPTTDEMYPNGLQKNSEDYGKLTLVLEGLHRPGHFDGVITIVKRLFDIVQPTDTFFGQKDFQQCMVVAALIKRNKLPITLHICPTLRENDGLAMSSRNTRLSEDERQAAALIFKSLSHVKNNFDANALNQIINEAKAIIKQNKLLKIEYLEVVNVDTLEHDTTIQKNKLVVLAAIHCGAVRLIDNMLIK